MCRLDGRSESLPLSEVVELIRRLDVRSRSRLIEHHCGDGVECGSTASTFD